MKNDEASISRNDDGASGTAREGHATSRRQFLATAATAALSAVAPSGSHKHATGHCSSRRRTAGGSAIATPFLLPIGYQTAETNPSVHYVVQARDLVNQRNYWDALPYLEKIDFNSFPTDLRSLILVLMSRALIGTGKVLLARQKLNQATALDASNIDGYIGLSWAEFLLGDLSSAARTVEIGLTKRPDHPSLRLIAALIARDKLRTVTNLPFGQKWHLRGEGVVCCPCAVPCPCRSNAPPTCGHCENISAVHVLTGNYGKVALSGLKYCLSHNCMYADTQPPILYADYAATDEQLIALEHIVQSFDPLNPFAFLHITRVPIRFEYSPTNKIYNIEIPGRLHMKVRRNLDGAGNPLLSTAAIDYYSNTIEYAKNLTYKLLDDLGNLRWDYSGHQANLRRINLDSANYLDGMMLVQFADGSGTFTEKQREIIRKLQLPTLASYPNPDHKECNR